MASFNYDGKPAWYIAKCKNWGNRVRKHGVSHRISTRKNQYVTANPDKVEFEIVFFLNQQHLSDKGLSLYKLDSFFFPNWLKGSGLQHVHLQRGGGTEFYESDDHRQLVLDFFDSFGLVVEQEICDDSQFPPFQSRKEQQVLKENGSELDKLLKQFKDVFLNGGNFRPYQQELWDLWCCQLNTKGGCRGIVQWPTASGKTIAELLLIVLTANSYARRGQVYRGVIIAPKNDILQTQMKHIRKLELFGFVVYEGHGGRLSSLTLPLDQSVVLTSTHAAFTNESVLQTFPPFNHVHYDEVHRITGHELATNLSAMLPKWNTEYLTGTSATPLTSNPTQRDQLVQMFGGSLNIIHRTNVTTMCAQGYIAKPRFLVNEIQNGSMIKVVQQVIDYTVQVLNTRFEQELMKGGKCIVYFQTLEQVRCAFKLAKERSPAPWRWYAATDDAPAEHTDDCFVKDQADGTPKILLACEKYREGSDIYGLECTIPLLGKHMSAHILLQIIGRALRKDYASKEGWCCVVRPAYADDEDVLEHIVLNIASFLSMRSEDKAMETTAVKQMLQGFFGQVQIEGKTLSLDETLHRVQALYARKNVVTFEKMQLLNRDFDLKSRTEYEAYADQHVHYVADPATHYRGAWTTWYSFLGVDCSRWPPNKTAWKEECLARNLTSWLKYSEHRDDTLPPNPTEMYADFTSWYNEFPESTDDDW